MPELESLGSIPMAVAAVAMLLAAAAGLGSLCLQPATVERWREVDAILLRLIVGLNLLGLLGVVLGLPGLLSGGRSVWLLAGLSLLLAPALRWRRRDGGPRAARQWHRGTAWWVWVPFLALTVVTLGPALCYPTGWDELVYHEVLPRRWLADGWPAFYPDLPYSGFPSLGEILFWLIAPIESVIAPRLLIWACWIVGLVCLYRMLRWHLAPWASLILVFAFTLNDTVLLISANCYVETILMMNVVGMLLVIGLPRRRGGFPKKKSRDFESSATWTRAAILGVLAGGAAGVKLTGCAAIAVPCLWYAGEAWRDRSRRSAAAAPLAVYLITALCVGLPFYLRPWLATGNPFYPYLCAWFTDDPARIEMSHFQHAIGGYAYGIKTVTGFLDTPLLLAFRSNDYDGEFGWQLLVLLVLAILAITSTIRPRARGVVLWPAAASLWLYAFWFVTAQQARFAVPAMVAFTTLAGLGLRRLHGVSRRFVLAILVVLATASIPWRNSAYYWVSWLTVTGRKSRTEYVDIGTLRGYLPLVDAIYTVTPSDAKVLLLFEHRGFYIPRRFVIGTPLFQEGPFSPPEKFTEAAAVMEVILRDRITHLVVATASAGPDHSPNSLARQNLLLPSIAQCVRQGGLQLEWESEEFAIFAVR